MSIALKDPDFFNGRRFPLLAPLPFMVYDKTMSEERYTSYYNQKILAKLNAGRVFEELGGMAVLLCWERPGEFCHRRLIAQWFEKELGLEVPEMKVTYIAPTFEKRANPQKQLSAFF